MKKRSWFKSHEHWVMAILWVFFAGWAADAIKDTVEAKLPHQIMYWRLGILLVFALTTLRLYKIKTRFFDLQLEEMVPDEHPYKRKILICFLSTAEGDRSVQIEDGAIRFRNRLIPIDDQMFQAFNELRAQEPNSYWPWEVLFRMFLYHREAVQRVILVCSCQTISHAPLFGRIFSQFVAQGSWPERPQLEVVVPKRGNYITVGTDYAFKEMDGFDFHEDFAKISLAMQAVVADIEHQGYRKSDIAIDFTGGTKVTSIVAAGLTFNNSIQAQHVRLKNGDLQVTGYDMVYSNRTGNDIA